MLRNDLKLLDQCLFFLADGELLDHIVALEHSLKDLVVNFSKTLSVLLSIEPVAFVEIPILEINLPVAVSLVLHVLSDILILVSPFINSEP